MSSYFLPILLFVSGMASAAIEEKFKGERREDAASFAERTHDLFIDDYFSVLNTRWGLLHRVPGSEVEAETALREKAERISALMTGIKQYSRQVLIIAESAQSDSAKAQAIASYLSERAAPLATALGHEANHFDAVIAKISQQKNLREALRSAQPLFDAAEHLMQQHLTSAEQQVSAVEQVLLAKIDEHYAPILTLHDKLDQRKRPLVQKLGAQLPTKLDSADNAELQYLNAVQALIGTDYERLLQCRQLVNESKTELQADLARLRSTMSIWVRAHAKMSKGIYHPAEWFEVDELPKRLVKKIGL